MNGNNGHAQFEVQTWSGSHREFEHISIKIWDGNGSGLFDRPIHIEWQATVDKEEHGWYAPHFELGAQRPADLKEQMSMLRRLLRGMADYDKPTPTAVVAKLRRMQATEVVYDPRLHERVAIDEVPDPRLKRWMNNWYLMNETSCTVSCLAETEEEAKRLIAAEYATHGYNDKLIKFLNHGSPVCCSSGYLREDAPDARPAEEKIAPFGPEVVQRSLEIAQAEKELIEQ